MNYWFSNNYIEIFGALAGIIYVFLEIRQTIWLWPVGLITSAVYVWIFFTSKLYADMSLQAYYVIISILGWYWWMKGDGHGAKSMEQGEEGEISPLNPLQRIGIANGVRGMFWKSRMGDLERMRIKQRSLR